MIVQIWSDISSCERRILLASVERLKIRPYIVLILSAHISIRRAHERNVGHAVLIAEQLAGWAYALEPSAEDMVIAERALVDTLAVAVAAKDDPIMSVAGAIEGPAAWAVAAHVVDFDDLHIGSTSHLSAVSVPAVAAVAGDAVAYLAAAGAMAHLGSALGWSHYASGWHATCTTGAIGAAVGAARAMGLSAEAIAVAAALAVPGAGGVQRAFGTMAKSLQVGFAVETGLRAARLAAAGAGADVGAVDEWFALVGGSGELDFSTDDGAIPGGLALKLFPCCYAMQRIIWAVRDLKQEAAVDPAGVTRIRVRTPESSVVPLIHSRPTTGLEGKFSLEYAIACGILDDHQGFGSFTDAAVNRPMAQRLMEKVEASLTPGGSGLLDGEVEVVIETNGGTRGSTRRFPAGAPQCPPDAVDMKEKVSDCVGQHDLDPESWTWETASDVLSSVLPGSRGRS